MQIGWELGKRLEKLREFLTDEIKRLKMKLKLRETVLVLKLKVQHQVWLLYKQI